MSAVMPLVGKQQEINKALLLKYKFTEEIEFSGVSIDTRTIKKGNLFIPIKGKKRNRSK